MFNGQGMGPGMMHGFGGSGMRIFHNGVQVDVGGGGQNIFQQLNKPPPIIKNVNLTMEQAFNGDNIKIELERWVIIQDMKVNEKIEFSISIPKGIDHNELIMIRDQGHVINENNKGDLKLIIVLENHVDFIRNGLDIVYKKKITLKESLCGFKFEINFIKLFEDF